MYRKEFGGTPPRLLEDQRLHGGSTTTHTLLDLVDLPFLVDLPALVDQPLLVDSLVDLSALLLYKVFFFSLASGPPGGYISS